MEEENEKEEPKKKASKKGLIFGLIGINLVAAGAVGYFVLMGQAQAETGEEDGDAEDSEASAEGDSESGSEGAEPPSFGPLVEDKPLVGNLNDPAAGRYVKVKLHYEIANEELRPRMEMALVPLRSELLIYFTGIKVEDTIGKENKQRIVADIQKLAQKVAGEGVVKRVFFTEFVTQ